MFLSRINNKLTITKMFKKVQNKMPRQKKIIWDLKTCVIFFIYYLDIYVATISKKPGVKYILQWTRTDREPFVYWKPKRKQFTFMNCEYQNCYITQNANLFPDATYFDAILFNGIDIRGNMKLPEVRADSQIYVFLSTESASNFPIYGYNWFFNYTWTYKLNSDILYPDVIVRDKRTGLMIAPNKNVPWMTFAEMKKTKKSVIKILQSKKIAAAWFVSNCYASNGRLVYAGNLRQVLLDYNLELDIYGQCGPLDCPRGQIDECLAKVRSDYYFYLSFENSFSEDYVTEKLLFALDNYAIPIVYGGANYNRIMPDGIYLNARNLSEEELGKTISEIISNRKRYYEYFKWHWYYSYHNSWESADTDPVCAFCAFLNGNWSNERRVYANFGKWWNEFAHEVPQTEQEGIIHYYKKPIKSEPPYLSYWRPESGPNTIIGNIGEFLGNVLGLYVGENDK